MRNCGVIDPEEIDEYLDRGGYQALAKALSSMSPEQVIESSRSAAFEAAAAPDSRLLKWTLTRESKGAEHIIVCNGDEAIRRLHGPQRPRRRSPRRSRRHDPRRICNRSQHGLLLHPASTTGHPTHREGDPAGKGRRTPGHNILGTDFSFTPRSDSAQGFRVRRGNRLIASLEGKRGPVASAALPVGQGPVGQPTMINNVESLANLSQIILRGGEWFASIGMGKSTGTKVSPSQARSSTPGSSRFRWE